MTTSVTTTTETAAGTTTPRHTATPKNLYNKEAYQQASSSSSSATRKPERPWAEVDYRSRGGPKLTYLWPHDEQDALVGQTLYLGGEVGSDGRIYYIPGHAPRVLQLDPTTNVVQAIGPVLPPGKFKYLRGVVVGDVLYGLPCHAATVLRIHVPSGEITTLPIPYETFYGDELVNNDKEEEVGTESTAGTAATTTTRAHHERHRPWKYHGGTRSPADGCIYAIPQSARHVLRIDPQSDTCTLVGPALPGRWKWYGGVVGRQDGAIYAVPHDASQVLRIHPTDGGITLHGTYAAGGHKWHGAAAAADGTIVCVPANADTVLCMTPASPAPVLTQVGDASVIATGRHRRDTKYKYLGATTGPDGKVYLFPSGSEHVLQVDTTEGTPRVRRVGPNLYDARLEVMCQNKWQNGLLDKVENAVYGIPLAAESLLRIDCSKGTTGTPVVTTWPLPRPYKGLGKFEGGVVAPNGILYTVPNNHKAILRIEPALWAEGQSFAQVREHCKYRGGVATLRSSAHRVKGPPQRRQQHHPQPTDRDGRPTNTVWLPESVCETDIFDYDTTTYNLAGALQRVLQACDDEIVGTFREASSRLEDFEVPVASLWRVVNGGQCETAQKYLSDQMAQDPDFLSLFDAFVQGAILPRLKDRLVAAGVVASSSSPESDEADRSSSRVITFYYQRPPTIRLQPGPAWAHVKPHNDAEYGHQYGELNFWIPFTDRTRTRVDFWCESQYRADDYQPLQAVPGQVIAFHGSSCRHYVSPNKTDQTRVSMDFRVGVQGFFDPKYQMNGTTDDHSRQEFTL